MNTKTVSEQSIISFYFYSMLGELAEGDTRMAVPAGSVSSDPFNTLKQSELFTAQKGKEDFAASLKLNVECFPLPQLPQTTGFCCSKRNQDKNICQ